MAKQPPFKIDDESYRAGRDAFTCGCSLRSIVEQLAAFGADQVEDQKAFSGVLGFFDALLDQLRPRPQLEPRAVVEHPDGTVTPLSSYPLNGVIRGERAGDIFSRELGSPR
ncbi:hypothetical protein [Rhodopseudomonas pseudopalustris]|uniref:Uncharacterized protein n=1 Tax=Rhodopseudomonas pseudopalustris TaxID=1513892 RepID=A0A1H8V8L6_9BRAD|nr:hypothetical protein [Rhodopseudomonas pseudopalustris]SEP11775.1 hypothetical protein SAMN05444123_108126 [Rhodopseudomonas pseudopalustris]